MKIELDIPIKKNSIDREWLKKIKNSLDSDEKFEVEPSLKDIERFIFNLQKEGIQINDGRC